MTAYQDWIGRSQAFTEVLDPARSAALDVAFGGSGALKAGDPLPLLDHWLYFWDVQPPAALGPDGHPARGGFLPPVALQRRMWAGGRVQFLKPLRLGESATRTSTIVAISEKVGRSGPLVFVTVRHDLEAGEGVAVREEQDLVFRDAPADRVPMPSAAPAPAATWHQQVMPDPVLLFRYSALTLNGHRIHYDKPYAIHEEGYPGLVVHGPMQAALLIRLAASSLGAPVARFEYRGQQPAFDGLPLHLCAEPSVDGVRLWTQQGDQPNMVATAQANAS